MTSASFRSGICDVYISLLVITDINVAVFYCFLFG